MEPNDLINYTGTAINFKNETAQTRGIQLEALAWKADYEIGEAKIDDQHRQLVKLANNVYAIVERGEEGEDLLDAFEALISYTEMHFREEERLWLKIDSAHFTAQEKDHDKLARELRELIFPKDAVAQGKVGANLKEWLNARLLPHMMEHDQKAAAQIGA